MSATVNEDEGREDSGPATLGDLLYAHPGRVRVPESEWVDLVKAVAAGDQRALYGLYARMHRVVFTSILRIVRIRETAEELTVDVFHDVWRRAAGYDPAGGSVVGWIMNQARSRAIDRLRFEQRRKRINPHPQDPQAEEAGASSEAVLEAEDQERLLRSALAVLTPHEREAIETAYFSEYTYHETADRLKEPLGTIKTRIRSGLSKLRRAIVRAPEDP